MKCLVAVLLSAVGLMSAPVPASASTFLMNFDGIALGGQPIHGSATLDVGTPTFGIGPGLGTVEFNLYSVSSSAFSFTFAGSTTNGTGTISSAGTQKGLDSGNLQGAPFDEFDAQIFDAVGANSLRLTLFSLNTDPALPLLTLETMPATLASWVALYGPNSQLSVASRNGADINFSVTAYTLTATPILPSVLMLSTALAGLGTLVAARRGSS